MITRRLRLSNVYNKISLILFLLFCLIICAYPLVWLFYSSFKTMQELYENIFNLPKHIFLNNYQHIWSSSNFPIYYLNSLIVSTISVVGIVVISTMSGYVFARIPFKYREVLFFILLAGMMIPVQVTLIPNFVMLRSFNLLDTYSAMILPYIAFQVPVSVFIMRGFFREIPGELEDAACIDGCNKKKIFISIMVPLSKPAISTIIIFNFFTVWNELIFALTFTSSQAIRTIPVGIMDFVGRFETDYGYIFAALASASIPLLIVYFFAQKQIIQGLTAGALKG